MFGDISKKLHKRVEPYTQRERKHEGQIETFLGIVQPRVAGKIESTGTVSQRWARYNRKLQKVRAACNRRNR